MRKRRATLAWVLGAIGLLAVVVCVITLVFFGNEIRARFGHSISDCFAGCYTCADTAAGRQAWVDAGLAAARAAWPGIGVAARKEGCSAYQNGRAHFVAVTLGPLVAPESHARLYVAATVELLGPRIHPVATIGAGQSLDPAMRLAAHLDGRAKLAPLLARGEVSCVAARGGGDLLEVACRPRRVETAARLWTTQSFAAGRCSDQEGKGCVHFVAHLKRSTASR